MGFNYLQVNFTRFIKVFHTLIVTFKIFYNGGYFIGAYKKNYAADVFKDLRKMAAI